MKIITLLFIGIHLSSQFISANEIDSVLENPEQSNKCCGYPTQPNWSQIGINRLSTSGGDQWIPLNVPSYPETIELSINPSYGSTQGNVELTSTGIRIGQPGNYSVSFSTVLVNTVDNTSPIIPIFLVLNDVFDPNDPTTLGFVVVLPTWLLTSSHYSGILQNVPAGTTLSLQVTNGTGDPQVPIMLIAWDINVFKIPSDPDPTS